MVGDVILFQYTRKTIADLKRNERAIDDIKVAMRDYLGGITARHLSQRQAMLIQHINRCMDNIERIGDHIDNICDLSIRRQKETERAKGLIE